MRGARYLLFFLLVLFLGTGLWTWLTLQWAYSDGTRSGVLQKFARRGWICKTQEGDLALYSGGLSPQIWQFSVRDPRVAADIEKDVGARVQVHYTEHPGDTFHVLCGYALLRGPGDGDGPACRR